MKPMIIISANAEWRTTRELLSVQEVMSTPLGEWFELGGVRYFHGGWGKISAAATAQYVINHFQPGRALPCGEQAGQASNR